MNGEVYVLNKNKQPVKQFKIFEKGINFSTANNIAFDKNGRLWLMEDYLYLYNSKKNKFEKIDTNFSYASMLQSKNGKLFFTCGDNSIKELIQAKEKFVIKKTSFEKCIAERSTLFEDKKGRLYVNTVSEGLIVYKSVDDTSVVFKMNHAGIIKCYYETDSVLWMGTNYGLYKIIKPNFKYTVLTSADGLPDNCIYGIEPDMKKNLWLSTNKGICRFTPSTQLFRNYTFNDGLQSNEFNTNGYLMMPDGELWFSGVNGINAFYPSEIVEDNFIPKVQFTGIKVNDINYDNNINDENLLQLNYQNNTVSFNFLGINLYEPNNVQLQYQLAGVDKNWLPANNPGFARYANLKPGRYLFNVKAANIDGFISPALKTIIIEIASPFYMAWWFYLLCILVVASLVYAYTRFRIAQINRLYAVRNRIANDLHDDVGSALSTISLYSEVADLKIDSSLSEVKTIIQKIKNTSQQMQDSMHDIVWNLHHKNDTVEQLLLKLQLFANENTVVKNIHLVFLIDEDVKKIKLQQETRNVVFMVAKEAVNNAMKYSGASKIEICFKHTTGKLLFSIKDNGNGFDINTVKKGHGLSAMNERVDRVKGQILIQSKYGEGTLIEISVAI
jgi:two-component sensor histidine kinase